MRQGLPIPKWNKVESTDAEILVGGGLPKRGGEEKNGTRLQTIIELAQSGARTRSGLGNFQKEVPPARALGRNRWGSVKTKLARTLGHRVLTAPEKGGEKYSS